MAEVRFDDVEGLNAQGGEFGEWGTPTAVTQEMINQFADLTGDHQWIHVDVERANPESPFGGPVAHGFLTLSLIPGLAPPGAAKVVGHRARPTTAPRSCGSWRRCLPARRCGPGPVSSRPRRSRRGR